MFRRLRTKLTVFYAGLFVGTLLMVAMAVYAAVSNNAERIVGDQLSASSAMFDRLWNMRAGQLETGVALLSREPDFRKAVAANDQAAVRSTLDSLRPRLGVDLAFTIGADGRLTGLDERTASALGATSLAALQRQDGARGVLTIADAPFQMVSVPIAGPRDMGWVVFGARLNGAPMRAFEHLSAMPLNAEVVERGDSDLWRYGAGRGEADRIGRFIDQRRRAQDETPGALAAKGAGSIALVKPLQRIGEGEPVVLLLRYPIARAMEPYRRLLTAIALLSLVGVSLLVLGNWALARSLTRPISALEDAVKRLRRGETARVDVTTNDEIASLADSFNRMAADIGERERKIGHLALHDPHTGLPNRHSLERHISGLLSQSRRFQVETLAHTSDVFVMTLGIDRFAHVRGAIGYGLSGALIGAISARLLRLNPGLHVARLSTEVLGVAFEAESLEDALAFAAEVQIALEEPLRLGENTIDVSLTVGMAAKASSPGGVDLLVERADIALDQARAARQKIAVFDEAVYGDPAANLSLMSDLRRSIVNGELVIHHQPKYDLRQRAVTGVEALVRWRHPTRGMLPPDDFIGMAEETGHIRALTEWVLAQAIAEQEVLKRAGHCLTMSVNLSGRLLDDVAFADTALAMIEQAHGALCFEITETAVIEKPELALAMIERYAAAGVSISIDDYGAGLSSLAYLQRIRADELKIDKSFVLSMADSQRDALLVRSTIDLAHGLGLKVTAEGVETETVLALLAGMGCDVAQGYYLARPMALDKLLVHLADSAPNVRAVG